MSPKEVVEKWVDTFNKANAELLAALYAEDAINHHVNNEPLVGKEAIKQRFEKEFASAEMVCIIENIFEDGNWAILEWKDPKGFRGSGFFQIKNSLIQFQRGYWDKLTFLQLNNLPIDGF